MAHGPMAPWRFQDLIDQLYAGQIRDKDCAEVADGRTLAKRWEPPLGTRFAAFWGPRSWCLGTEANSMVYGRVTGCVCGRCGRYTYIVTLGLETNNYDRVW